MEIVLATGNQHKKDEYEQILKPHSILLPKDIGINYHAEETGKTYLENAIIKAQSLFSSGGGLPVIADDSGLSVPILDGAPGIYSARYGQEESGRKLNDTERNTLLLENMLSFKGEERRAFFVCCIVLMIDEYRVFTAQETFPGYIAEGPSGSNGFGYDPIFYLPEYHRCVAELDSDRKNTISHRGRASQKIKALLNLF